MARTADHAGRRRQIAGAVQRLIVHDGYDGVTVSKVAAEAGVSVGLVQHYFARKDDLLHFAYTQVLEDIRRRVDHRITAGEEAGRPIRTILFDALCEVLPLDRRRRAQFQVREAFWGRALDSDDLAQAARQVAAGFRAEIARAVENGKECGEVEPGVDASSAALRITAMVDGLARALYQEPQASTSGRRLRASALHQLELCLGEVFTGECRHHR